jgi:hypothetical protein
VALLLLYNREGQYANAQAMCRTLRPVSEEPAFVLESGATALRACNSRGERLLNEGITKFVDERPRAFGELGLLHSAAWPASRSRLADAKADLDRAARAGTRSEIANRSRRQAGRSRESPERRLAAYRDAIKLGEASQRRHG